MQGSNMFGASLPTSGPGIEVSFHSSLPPGVIASLPPEVQQAILNGQIPLQMVTINDYIHAAIVHQNIPNVTRILQSRPNDINQKDGSLSCLHTACGTVLSKNPCIVKGSFGWAKPTIAMVELLLSKGANINAVNRIGNIPLHTAAKANARLIPVLLSAGAILEQMNHAGQRPLHIAIEAGNIQSVRTLLAANSTPNIYIHPFESFISHTNRTPPLTTAVCANNPNACVIASMLLYSGASVQTIDAKTSETALFSVVKKMGKSKTFDAVPYSIAKLLIDDFGANTKYKKKIVIESINNQPSKISKTSMLQTLNTYNLVKSNKDNIILPNAMNDAITTLLQRSVACGHGRLKCSVDPKTTKFSQCGRCCAVRYCSREHQKADFACHKKQCKRIQRYLSLQDAGCSKDTTTVSELISRKDLNGMIAIKEIWHEERERFQVRFEDSTIIPVCIALKNLTDVVCVPLNCNEEIKQEKKMKKKKKTKKH